MITDDDREFFIYANWLHNNQWDSWRGWSCQAGSKRIFIDKNLEVYSGECENDYLGSALKDFRLLDRGTICKRDTCTGCTDDLTVEKTDINKN